MLSLSWNEIIENKTHTTMKYIYDAISISYSIWTGRSKEDYLEIINEKGRDGWRFVSFAPAIVRPKGVKGVELLFEKAIPDDE